MTVKKSDIPIPKPCDASWDAMHDQGTSRFCGDCTKSVHDLSQLTKEEAFTLLGRDEHLCVRYAHANDEIFFKDSTAPVWRLSRQLEGAKKLLAAAALIVPMLAACEPSQPDVKPEAVAPISIGDDGPSIKPGAGISPTFGTQPKPTTPEVVEAHPVVAVEHDMGEPPMLEEEVVAHELGNEAVEFAKGEFVEDDLTRSVLGQTAPAAQPTKGKPTSPANDH